MPVSVSAQTWLPWVSPKADQLDRAISGQSPAECLCSDCPSVLPLKPELNLAVVTHEHRAAPGLTSHPNKPPGCNQQLPVFLSPSPLHHACWASPLDAGLGDSTHKGSSPMRTLASPKQWCQKHRFSQKSLSKFSVCPQGIIPYGNDSVYLVMGRLGGDSIWNMMEIIKTVHFLAQCFSSVFSTPLYSSRSAGFQGRLSN